MRRRNPFRFWAASMGVATALLIAPTGCGISSDSKLTALPFLAGAVGTAASSSSASAREACPQCAITNSSAGGLLLHSSSETNNDTELSSLSGDHPRIEYGFAVRFLKLATLTDQYVCVLDVLKEAGHVNYDGEYAYIRSPSSNPVRVKITTKDDKIQSWEIASCTGSTFDRLLLGEADATRATLMLKYSSGTRLVRIDATGLIAENGSWGSKLVDISERDTGTNRGYRINVTQSVSTLQITGTEVNLTGPTLISGSASKARLYGTVYSNSSLTAYGLGAGSSRYTTDSSTYNTAHWTDAGASNTTSSFASDISLLTAYPASAYTDGISLAPFTTSESWDCNIGSTFVDLTSASIMTGDVATNITACLTSP